MNIAPARTSRGQKRVQTARLDLCYAQRKQKHSFWFESYNSSVLFLSFPCNYYIFVQFATTKMAKSAVSHLKGIRIDRKKVVSFLSHLSPSNSTHYYYLFIGRGGGKDTYPYQLRSPVPNTTQKGAGVRAPDSVFTIASCGSCFHLYVSTD